MREPCGIMLVDKPEGPTSRQVAIAVGRLVRPTQPPRRHGERRFRIGHAGTLDPLATGLLLVLVGRGTRLAPFLQGLDKRYHATVRFGVATDSHDRAGAVTDTAPVPAEPDGLAAAAEALRAADQQLPPVISSIKQGGLSLHRLVRKGREVLLAPRPVRIVRLAVTAVRWPAAPQDVAAELTAPDGRIYEVELDIECGGGTYVRALARDLGDALGTVAHLHALRRLAVGPFTVDEAVRLSDLEGGEDPGPRLRPLAAALPHLPAFTLSPEGVLRVRHGGQPEADWLPSPAPDQFRLLDAAGHLVAVGRRDPATGRAITAAVFAAAGDAATEVDSCA
ncbi:MAG: tRNA pseudouridine(55) synthase TruB [Candidatus Krumholzibacteria bacterium]|nr:tRNA pseudouridine(55) synthase TruB [Candidatus Krumholzibacteria bacterium]